MTGAGKVVRLRHEEQTISGTTQSFLLLGTESTYAGSRMVLLDSPSTDQAMDIFPLHGSPVDIVAMSSTPSTLYPDRHGYVVSTRESIIPSVPDNILEYLVPVDSGETWYDRGWIQVVGLDEPRGLAVLPLNLAE
ncbi:hypothetical protein JXA47_13075 [Candidatus Sumerlaeota bacterium]|nr:hypothetical protein [Candidatus Sumerlaeota bacterium]